jgi:hypothetical protein
MNSTFLESIQNLNAPLAPHHAFFLFGFLSLIVAAFFLGCICCLLFDIGGTRSCLEAARRRKYAPLQEVVVSAQPLLSPPFSLPVSKPKTQQQPPVNLRSPPSAFSSFIAKPLPIVTPLSPPPNPPPRGYYLNRNVFG